MDFRIETLAPCRKKIAVTIPSERIRAEYDKQYGEINQSFALPGFRKGHAPKKLLERRFAARLVDDVKESLVRAALQELVRDQKVEPLQPPSIDLPALTLEPGKPLAFEFELTTRPEFATPTWKGLEMRVAPVVVTPGEVEAAVEALRRREARLETAPEGVVGDEGVLVLEWKALEGDTVLAEDASAYHMLGRPTLAGFPAEEIDAGLRGRKAGATAEARVRAGDEDPREELRGKDLRLVVSLREVKRYVLPALDATFLSKHDYDDEAEMRKDMERQVQRGKTRERDRAAEEELVSALVAGVRFDLPKEIIDQELESWSRRRRAELEGEGLAGPALEAKVAEGAAGARAEIEADMRRFFVLDRIANEEGLEVPDAEVVQALQEVAAAYGRPVEEVLQAYRSGGRIEELRSTLRHRKVREAVRRAAHVVETAPAAPAAPPAPRASK